MCKYAYLTCLRILQIVKKWLCLSYGVNLTVQDLLLQGGARIQDLYFNISEIKLSITLLYIISDASKYDIIWTESSDVIDSLILKILKYESSVIESLTKKL